MGYQSGFNPWGISRMMAMVGGIFSMTLTEVRAQSWVFGRNWKSKG